MIADPVRHLYVHIPFCPSKCLYCAFVTHVGSLKLVEPYLDALMTEIDSIPPRQVGPLETVYIGGGTPSMLESRQMRSLLAHIRSRLTLTSGVEVSMEAHPSTVDREKLHGFREAGVTRI